jgi:chromate transporter
MTSTQGPVSVRAALTYWLKLGFVSFGGPTGQIAMMHEELVERRRWISERRFLHALNYAMLLPGPEAQQLATYIGWLMHGTLGGIAAGALFVLPSLALLCVLSFIYVVYGDVPAIAGVLYGIKPAVTAIVVFAAYRIGSRSLHNMWLWLIAAAAFVAIFGFAVPFPYIVLGAAIVGFIGGHTAPHVFATAGGHHSAARSHGAALIGDDTPLPAHAHFSWSRTIIYALVGLALWGVAESFLYLMFGTAGPLTQMGWFFTKAALLTFGGAYAVLPYVYQGGVETYGWLTAEQMIDGLALGETTPGPLIMIVAFVGFVGAWTTEALGPDQVVLAGLAGAVVATFFTFLPSFVFILVGGPAVEATRHEIKLTAPLVGITAAVVGVVLNLAAFFAWHVLWPEATATAPFAGRFEWPSLLIAVAALLALWRYKVGIIPVIGASAAAGLVHSLAVGYLFGPNV